MKFTQVLDVLFGMIAAGTGILVPALASVISEAARAWIAMKGRTV